MHTVRTKVQYYDIFSTKIACSQYNSTGRPWLEQQATMEPLRSRAAGRWSDPHPCAMWVRTHRSRINETFEGNILGVSDTSLSWSRTRSMIRFTRSTARMGTRKAPCWLQLPTVALNMVQSSRAICDFQKLMYPLPTSLRQQISKKPTRNTERAAWS